MEVSWFVHLKTHTFKDTYMMVFWFFLSSLIIIGCQIKYQEINKTAVHIKCQAPCHSDRYGARR